MLLEGQASADLLEAAAWAEINKWLLVGQSSEAGILDGAASDDISSQLKAKGYEQTALVFSTVADVWRAVGYVANRAAFDPAKRSAPWGKVGLVGVAADKLTPTQKTAAQAKNVNVHLPFRGQNVVGSGKVISGYDIELIISANWIQAEMERALAQLLYDRDQMGLGIEYTNDGLTVIKNAAAGVLAQAQAAGHIQPGWKVVMPNANDLTDAIIASGEVSFDWYAEPVKSVTAIRGQGLLFRGAVAFV